MKPQTYEDWKANVKRLLKELPENLRDKALTYQETSTMHSDDYQSCEAKTPAEALFFAFPFGSTEEGFDWWFETCEKLEAFYPQP